MAWQSGIAPHPGKLLRTARLFDARSGRSVIVAMDHGLFGRPQGLESLPSVLDRVLLAGPDGVLVSPGMLPHVAARLAGRGGPAIVVALNLYLSTTGPGGIPNAMPSGARAHMPLATLEEAVALGADCVKLLLIFADPDMPSHAVNMTFVVQTVEAARRWGMPVMVEPTLWTIGEVRPVAPLTADHLGHMARVAAELGADILKLPIAGPLDRYRTVVGESPVPVMVLGGARAGDTEAIVAMARQAVEAGASGLVFGRSVWQDPDPAGLVRRLRAVVHGEMPGHPPTRE